MGMLGAGLLGLAASNVRRNWARSAATTATILLAVTAFVVLTASAQTSQLVTTGTVNTNFRASYDVLVRPPGAQTPEEQATGRVRPNYLSGLFGGITLQQVQQVRSVPGVQVAAPVAMIGEVLQTVDMPVDVTADLNRDGPTLLRFSSQVATMRGLGSTPGWSGYVYVADRVSQSVSDPSVQQTLPSGQAVTVCPALTHQITSPLDADAKYSTQCWDTSSGLSGQGWPAGVGRVYVRVPVSFPVMLAAIDPQAENELTGLNSAVSSGAPLKVTDAARPAEGVDQLAVPVLATAKTYMDENTTVRVEKLAASGVTAITAGPSFDQARAEVTAAAGSPIGDTTFTAQQAHDVWLAGNRRLGAGSIYPRMLFQPSSVTYQGNPVTGLAPNTHPFEPEVWRVQGLLNEPFASVPPTAGDTGYRTITPIPAKPGLHVGLRPVGTFDPDKLSSQSVLSEVPLETYQPPAADPADTATAQLLKDQPLQPDSNPAGYLQSPPLLLTTMASLPAFSDPTNFDLPATSRLAQAPVSAVRVRIDGVTGADPVSRERIRLAAERIQQATGLAVDVTAGSSPAPTPVTLPASAHGTPELRLTERWTQKGVAAAIITAIDKKSLTLFLLILASTALAVAISAHAAVRARRTQLGVLSCVGWRPATLLREVLAELTVIGLAGGAGGALLSWPIAHAMSIDIPGWRALLAVPAALALALVAGVLPALAASRADPIEAVRPAVTARPRWTIRLRGTATMALSALSRTPGRVLAGAASLALGVTTLATLAGIVTAFNGAVVGTLLGDAISIQVRGPDVAAAVLLTIIGLASLADILYLDIKEQGSSYASLQACGWRDRTLTALIVWQAFTVAACGAIAGIVAALLLLSTLTALTTTLFLVTSMVGAIAVLAALIVSLAPALSLRRLRTAQLLTAD